MAGGDTTGGSRELAHLIDRYGEILLPDLKHYYGIDIRDLLREEWPLSPRFVLCHVMWLPIESAFIAERRGGQHYRGWDESRYQYAAIINGIKALTHIFILANTDPKKSKPKPPEPYPLPEGKTASRDKPGSFSAISKAAIDKAKKRKGVG